MKSQIKRGAVDSGQIESVGHEGDILAVKFKGGPAVYHYHGVTPQQHQELLKAESLGGHLHKHIKGKFKVVKIV